MNGTSRMTKPSRPRAVIDPHHHFWNLANDQPWLKHELIPFRYGDYSAIGRDYRTVDHRAYIAGWPVVGSVDIEAEWGPRKGG